MATNPTPGNSNVKYLWPTPILTKTFADHQTVNPELVNFFYAYRKHHRNDEPVPYASPDTLLDETNNKAVKAIAQFISDAVFEIAAEVNMPYWGEAQDIQVVLSGLWFQISNEHAFHETHVHGNCSWSGVYYVQAGDHPGVVNHGVPNGITRFYGPSIDYTGGGHGEFGNLYLQDYAFDSVPSDGNLVVFPPHVKHMAFPYHGERDRIIISFHAQVHSSTPYRPSSAYEFAK